MAGGFGVVVGARIDVAWKWGPGGTGPKGRARPHRVLPQDQAGRSGRGPRGRPRRTPGGRLRAPLTHESQGDPGSQDETLALSLTSPRLSNKQRGAGAEGNLPPWQPRVLLGSSFPLVSGSS